MWPSVTYDFISAKISHWDYPQLIKQLIFICSSRKIFYGFSVHTTKSSFLHINQLNPLHLQVFDVLYFFDIRPGPQAYADNLYFGWDEKYQHFLYWLEDLMSSTWNVDIFANADILRFVFFIIIKADREWTSANIIWHIQKSFYRNAENNSWFFHFLK